MSEKRINEAFDRFLTQKETIKQAQNTNEATTRLLAIDTMLFDVLQWDKKAAELEKYCKNEGYADYAFLQQGKPSLILEAKKEGCTFILPETNDYVDRAYSFSLIANECPDAKNALYQAAGYATNLGSRYVTITNGFQWIIALSFEAGRTIEERSVIVFESLNAIESRFRFFWKCFSQDGVFSNDLSEILSESRKTQAPPKLSTTITGYPVPANRNVKKNELSYVLSQAWTEANRNDNRQGFLENCYIKPKDSEDLLMLSRELFEQRHLRDEMILGVQSVTPLIRAEQQEKPIVILGEIGHGKSTFLKYLREVGAKDELANYVQINLDFLDRPESASGVSDYCYNQISSQLSELYNIDVNSNGVVRASLDLDLKQLKKTPEGIAYADNKNRYIELELDKIRELQKNRHEYLTKVFHHFVRGQGRSIALFFDNLDQRNDGIQEEAFLRASAMARDWKALVFICLRPSTFYRSKTFGVLDSLAPRVIVVAPPLTKPLLTKRFAYAISLLTDETSSNDVVPSGKQISLRLPSTQAILERVQYSFQKNNQLCALFESLSNGNVRYLLEMVQESLTNSHLDTKKISEAPSYIMPVHEALRSILFGESFHFDPVHSPIANMYETIHSDKLEHFSRLLLLEYLFRQRKIPHNKRGLCSIDEIQGYLCQLGYTPPHVNATLQFLFEKQCCECSIPGVKWPNRDSLFRITNWGKYHITHLIETFVYNDAMIVDTPIIDATLRSNLRDVRDISDRLKRCEKFLSYLDVAAENLHDAQAILVWTGIAEKIRQNITEIRRRIRKKKR